MQIRRHDLRARNNLAVLRDLAIMRRLRILRRHLRLSYHRWCSLRNLKQLRDGRPRLACFCTDVVGSEQRAGGNITSYGFLRVRPKLLSIACNVIIHEIPPIFSNV